MATQEVVSESIEVLSLLPETDKKDIEKIIDSFPYDPRFQQFTAKLRKIIQGTKGFQSFCKNGDDAIVRKVREFSEIYKTHSSQLLRYFDEWRPGRKNLIEKLISHAEEIDFNFTVVSWIRIFVAGADLTVNMARILNESDVTITSILLGNLSIIGWLSCVCEKTRTKTIFNHFRKAFDEDLEILKKIKEWFQQKKDLDFAVKSFFPYGIDEEITRKVNEYTENADEYTKIFMSVVASNGKKDTTLCTDLQFLDKAELFASSEAGVLWFAQFIIEQDPEFMEFLSFSQEKKIQNALKLSHDCTQVDATLHFPLQMCRDKVILDAINIMLTFMNWMGDANKEKSDSLRKIAKKSQEQLQHVQKLVYALTVYNDD